MTKKETDPESMAMIKGVNKAEIEKVRAVPLHTTGRSLLLEVINTHDQSLSQFIQCM